jgi:hypothetical protein
VQTIGSSSRMGAANTVTPMADLTEAGPGTSTIIHVNETGPGWRVLAILSTLMGFASISTDLFLPAIPPSPQLCVPIRGRSNSRFQAI